MRDTMEQHLDNASEPMVRHRPLYREGYIEVIVEKPITHQTLDQGRFTTYLISIETNNQAFSLLKSTVRRRYSEFVWLRSWLSNTFTDCKLPRLPPKKYFGRQFDPQIIEDRMLGLQDFLLKVTSQSVFLSDGSLHLFLQSHLSLREIEDCLEGRSTQGVLETIMQASPTSQDRSKGPSVSSSGYDSSDCLNVDTLSEGQSEQLTSPVAYAHPHDSDSPSCHRHLEPVIHSEATKHGLRKSSSTPAFMGVGRTRSECYHGMRSSLDVPGSLYSSSHSISKYSDSDMSSNSSASGIEARKNRKKLRRVTFSPEVTVSEVIDRFSRSPRIVRLSEVPSGLIASTMAY